MQSNPYDLLNIITNKGEVITSEDHIVVVDSELDAIELFVTERVQDTDGTPNVVGPAYISNFEDFQGLDLILSPTLAGAIAEGIILSSEITSATLQLDFDCQET